MDAGSLSEIYSYPVKSMAGERLVASEIGQAGLPGDRAWAVRDEVRGGIRGGKKIPALMQLSARYPAEQVAGRSTAAEITLPGGVCVSTGDDNINSLLSEALEHKVSLWPLVTPDLHIIRKLSQSNAEPGKGGGNDHSFKMQPQIG